MLDVTVVGAGTMGHGIAQVFAQKGHRVFLNDISSNALRAAEINIFNNLKTLSKAGTKIDDSTIEDIRNRIRFSIDLPLAIKNADLVIEAIVEDPEVKRQLFMKMDTAAPRKAIFASNTSHLDIFNIVDTVRPENLIIAHWFNPPHIMPLVEIVLGPRTSQETQTKIRNVLSELGKETITLKKYIPGFIGNRLQGAMNLEFYHLLDSGLISPEEIDKVVKWSFGLRLPVLGIAERCDHTGLDVIQNILSNRSYNPPPVRGKCETIDRLVAKKCLGVKTLKGFYDYGDRKMEDVLRDRDLKLMKLKNFIEELMGGESRGERFHGSGSNPDGSP